jgi:hypothetical protein
MGRRAGTRAPDLDGVQLRRGEALVRLSGSQVRPEGRGPVRAGEVFPVPAGPVASMCTCKRPTRERTCSTHGLTKSIPCSLFTRSHRVPIRASSQANFVELRKAEVRRQCSLPSSFGIGLHLRQRSLALGMMEHSKEGSRDHERTRLPGQGGGFEETLGA